MVKIRGRHTLRVVALTYTLLNSGLRKVFLKMLLKYHTALTRQQVLKFEQRGLNNVSLLSLDTHFTHTLTHTQTYTHLHASLSQSHTHTHTHSHTHTNIYTPACL